MRRPPVLKFTPLIAALLCGTTAAADVTAREVWNNWTEQMDIAGQTFSTGGEAMSGDTLVISDLRVTIDDDEIALLAEVGDIALTENGDGTVSITMADSYPMTVEFTPQFDDPTTLALTVAQSGMVILASGTAEALQYDITADVYSITADSLEGDAADRMELGPTALVMGDLAGTYDITGGEVNDITYAFEVGTLDLDVTLIDPEDVNGVMMRADMADLSMDATLSIPVDADMEADMPPFADGFAVAGGYAFGAVSYMFDIKGDGDQVSGTASVASGGTDFGFDYDGLFYSGGAQGIDLSFLMPEEVPFPIELSLDRYGFDVDIPLSQGEDGPRDARLAFDLTGLSASDGLWNLFDPAQVLPRDPVTVALGLDAQVTPFFDFLDPDQQEAIGMTEVPGELNALEITALTISGAGADITGDGAFTFDNSDLTTFDGFPRPQGEVNLSINGVNGLIDKLIQMGLIPQDQAMMPRMMLGMFATPVGEDMLTSTIGINAEGHVLANGQRLR